MTIRPDISLTAEAQYGSKDWVAQVIGKSRSWLEKNMGQLTKHGFPAPDPLIGLTYKPDVYAWMEMRRKYKNHDIADPAINQKGGENLEAL